MNKLMFFSDAIRVDSINDIINGDIIPFGIHDDPDTYYLLDPYDGYDKQTYIQSNESNSTIIFWEGWSDLCWEGAYSKEIYIGKSKEEILEHIKTKRFPIIVNNLNGNYKIDKFEYWQENVFDYNDYIMRVSIKKN